MALPKIDTPIYVLRLPLSGKEIKFRPFLVKEHKNLMMAKEADDYETILRNVKQVLVNCTMTEGIDIEQLPIIDIEFYFLNLRARSSGEVIDLKYICNNDVDDRECGNTMETSLNLLDVNIQNHDDKLNLIEIGNNMTVKLSYPKFSSLKEFQGNESLVDLAINMIADSIEYIYDGEQYYYANESTKEELLNFVESLNQNQFSKLETFFENIPKLNKTIDITCSKCGFHHIINVEGLDDFFG